MCIGGNLPSYYGANSVWIACIDHTPSPMQGVLIVSIGLGTGGGGEVKGQLSLIPVAALVVRERMRKSPAVQSGRTFPPALRQQGGGPAGTAQGGGGGGGGGGRVSWSVVAWGVTLD